MLDKDFGGVNDAASSQGAADAASWQRELAETVEPQDEPLYGAVRAPKDRRHGFARSSRRLLFGGLTSGSVNQAGVGTNLNTGGTGTNPAFNANACYCQALDSPVAEIINGVQYGGISG